MLQLISEDVGFAGTELPEPTDRTAVEEDAALQQWMEHRAAEMKLWVNVEAMDAQMTPAALQHIHAVQQQRML